MWTFSFTAFVSFLTVVNCAILSITDYGKYDKFNSAADIMIQKLDLYESRNVDIIMIGSYQKYLKIGSAIQAQKDTLFRIFRYSALKGNYKRWNNVFIISNHSQFEDAKGYMKNSFFDFEGFYLVIIDDDVGDVKGFSRKMFDFFYSIYIVNIVVIYYDEIHDRVDLMTYFPFGPGECDNVEPTVFNTFGYYGFRSGVFFPRKLHNFYGCKVKVIFIPSPPFVEFSSVNGTLVVKRGYEVYLMEYLAEVLNFTMDSTVLNNRNDPSIGTIYKNGTTTGAVNMLNRGMANVTLGWLSITKERMDAGLSPSITYLNIPVLLVAPPPKPFGPIELLLLPFDSTTWFIIVVIMGIASVVILLLNFINRQWRNFVVGESNREPLMNLLNICLNGYTSMFPRRNFARTLAILLMLTTIVLRSAYQGSIFGYLRFNRRHQGASDYNYYLAKGYKVYVSLRMYSVFKDISTTVQDHLIVYNDNDVECFSKFQDPDFKGLVLINLNAYRYYHQKTAYRYADHPIPEPFLVDRVVMYFRQNSYLLRPFNKFILNFNDGGLFIYYKRRNNYGGTVIFNNTKAVAFVSSGWYYLCGITMTISLLILFLEILSSRVRILGCLFEWIT